MSLSVSLSVGVYEGNLLLSLDKIKVNWHVFSDNLAIKVRMSTLSFDNEASVNVFARIVRS